MIGQAIRVIFLITDHGSLTTSRRSAFAKASARQSSLSSTRPAKTGGKGIRTPDFQLAKLALYQLSYAPCEFSILDCGRRIANGSEQCAWCPRFRANAEAGCRSNQSPSGIRAPLRTGEAAFVGCESGPVFLIVPRQVPPNMVSSHYLRR
jgi:hypothetical protein